ncbi:MAG: cupin domain-containing protein [Candidatus Marinimicrobia bacterium]|nr:cupin domain-containing protein [Candidatus Neomarinimicrobiota bacterium]
MKPLINVEDITEFKGHEHGAFKSKYADVGGKIGARQLGYNITIIPSGKKSWPFHNHHVSEEMFLILEGTGLLRHGENQFKIKKNDIIACPTGDRSVAHQIINDGDTDLKYLALGTKRPYDICEYPDSDKILSRVTSEEDSNLWNMSKGNESYDYFEGEE